MDPPGAKEPQKEEDLAQKFMEADEEEKIAILNQMNTGFDLEKIVPQDFDINSWDESTKKMVYKKSLDFLFLGTSKTKDTVEAVKEDQRRIQFQLKDLKEKRDVNFVVLADHTRITNIRQQIVEQLEENRNILARYEAVPIEMRQDQFAQHLHREVRGIVDFLQYQLDHYAESPLRE